MSNIGVKFNLRALKHLALHILTDGSWDRHSEKLIDPRSEQPLYRKIHARIDPVIYHSLSHCQWGPLSKKRLSFTEEM